MKFAMPPMPQTVWGYWNWDPLLLLGLGLAAVVYARGVVRLWRRAGVGRGVSAGQALAFAGGWLALAAALVSPLDALGAALLSAHMVQHLLLTLAAAPLLAVGFTPVVAGWGLPHSRVLGRLRAPQGFTPKRLAPPAWGVHITVLWIWHLPSLYQAALRSEGVHILEHATFLGAALLFWWTVLHGRAEPARRRPRWLNGRRLMPLEAALALFTTAILSGFLGVLLTFSPAVWYPYYGVLPYGWGMTPLADQQIAGAIMWFPGGLVYLLASLLLLGRALQGRPTPGAGERRAGHGEAVVAPRRPLKMQN